MFAESFGGGHFSSILLDWVPLVGKTRFCISSSLCFTRVFLPWMGLIHPCALKTSHVLLHVPELSQPGIFGVQIRGTHSEDSRFRGCCHPKCSGPPAQPVPGRIGKGVVVGCFSPSVHEPCTSTVAGVHGPELRCRLSTSRNCGLASKQSWIGFEATTSSGRIKSRVSPVS